MAPDTNPVTNRTMADKALAAALELIKDEELGEAEGIAGWVAEIMAEHFMDHGGSLAATTALTLANPNVKTWLVTSQYSRAAGLGVAHMTQLLSEALTKAAVAKALASRHDAAALEFELRFGVGA